MSSKAQIAANRKNAKKSTGPKTAEGKAKSAQNATTHGLTATHDVIKGESQEEFDAHKQGFLDALKPQDAVEDFLADRVVALTWRLKRAARIHNQLFDCMLADHNFDTLGHIMKKYTTMWQDIRAYPSTQDPDLNLGAVVRRDYKTDNILHRFIVYERRIENSFLKCFHELNRRKRIKTTDPDIPSHPCHPQLDSGPHHPGKQPTRTHTSGTLQKKQTQSSEVENTASPLNTVTYAQNHHGSRPQNKPIEARSAAIRDRTRNADTPRRAPAIVRRY